MEILIGYSAKHLEENVSALMPMLYNESWPQEASTAPLHSKIHFECNCEKSLTD